MKTVGIILKDARAAKGYSLETVEKETKIRLKFLRAIESDDYSGLPSLAYSKGFVKNYAEFLGRDSRTVLAFFRRQTTEIPKSTILPKGVAEPLNKSLFRLTPGRFLAGLLVGLVVAFLFYFGLQYKKFHESPALSLESPINKIITSEHRVDVTGKTDPDATITINGVSVIVRSDGRFFDQAALEPGVNTLTVVATSRLGKTTTLTREVGVQTNQ